MRPTASANRYALFIIGILFFVFGFLTWINGILIPYFKICMDLSNLQATLVAFASYFAYFVMALPSAALLRRVGYRKGMVLGLCLMAVGTLLFVPAAYSRAYPLFLGGLFVTASGLAVVQTAANPYIAIIGPIEGTAKRIGIMGLCNKLAGIVCLIVLGNVFLANADEVIARVSTLNPAQRSAALDAYALKIVEPYVWISALLLGVALFVYRSNLPEIQESTGADNVTGETLAPKSSAFQYPYLVFGMLTLFVTGACENIPIDGIILYSSGLNIPMDEARHYSTYTLYVMLAGYLAVTLLSPRYVSQPQIMAFAALWGLLFTVATYFSTGLVSVYCLMLLGFSASMLWGTIWGLAIRALGPHTKTGSALLIMSLIGAAIFPVLFGWLLDASPEQPQLSVLLLIPCYAVVGWYAVWGHRILSWKSFFNHSVSQSYGTE